MLNLASKKLAGALSQLNCDDEHEEDCSSSAINAQNFKEKAEIALGQADRAIEHKLGPVTNAVPGVMAMTYLLNSAHYSAASNPGLSRIYLQSFIKHANENGISIDNSTKKLFCGFCGTIYIPGINCSMTVEKPNSSRRKRLNQQRKKKQKHHNTSHTAMKVLEEQLIRCLSCNNVNKYPIFQYEETN